MTAASATRRPATEPPSGPWWKFGHVWLLIAGPVTVVVAGFVTGWIAVHGKDPVIDPNYYQNGLRINQQLQHPEKALAPAQQGRNHAISPVLPKTAPAGSGAAQ